MKYIRLKNIDYIGSCEIPGSGIYIKHEVLVFLRYLRCKNTLLFAGFMVICIRKFTSCHFKKNTSDVLWTKRCYRFRVLAEVMH